MERREKKESRTEPPREDRERRPTAPPIEREHETADGALGASDEEERGMPRSPPLVPEDHPRG